MAGKKIIFCIGVNELAEHKDILFSAVSDRLGILSSNRDKIDFSIGYFPGDLSQWRNVDDELSDMIFTIVGETGVEVLQVIQSDIDKIAESFDAYYGSPSPLATAFLSKGKPVMLSDLAI